MKNIAIAIVIVLAFVGVSQAQTAMPIGVPDDGSVVDVLVYVEEALARRTVGQNCEYVNGSMRLCDRSDIEPLTRRMIGFASKVFENSGVLFKLNVVSVRVKDTTRGKTKNEAIRGFALLDRYADYMFEHRDQSMADIVVVLSANNWGTGGVSIGGPYISGDILPVVIVNYHLSGLLKYFNSGSSFSDITIAHEIGHLFGLKHSSKNSTVEGGYPAWSSFTDSEGNKQCIISAMGIYIQKSWMERLNPRQMMDDAYYEECDEARKSMAFAFSNPRIEYKHNDWTQSVVLGNDGADSVSVLNERRHIVANYR